MEDYTMSEKAEVTKAVVDKLAKVLTGSKKTSVELTTEGVLVWKFATPLPLNLMALPALKAIWSTLPSWLQHVIAYGFKQILNDRQASTPGAEDKRAGLALDIASLLKDPVAFFTSSRKAKEPEVGRKVLLQAYVGMVAGGFADAVKLMVGPTTGAAGITAEEFDWILEQATAVNLAKAEAAEAARQALLEQPEGN
jgi:hypothetical protein